MIHPVYNVVLTPERTDTYDFRIREDKSVGSDYPQFGRVEVGVEVPLDIDVYRLGENSGKEKISMSFGIAAVNHLIQISLKAKAEQGNLSPELRPYDEDPISLKAIGIKDNQRYSLAGIYYPSNQYVGWMNINRQD